MSGLVARLLGDAKRGVPAAVATIGLLLASAALLGAPADGDPDEAAAALARGNRLARRGELDAAVQAYGAGWPAGGAAGAALAYNLGTTHHRMEQLPQALLWYRRAAELAPGDPWVNENLELARAELAASRYPAPGLPGRLAAHPAAAPLAAVLLAWTALALWLLRPRLLRSAHRLPEPLLRHAWAAVALLSLGAWTVAVALAAWGPRPAVLLDPCAAGGGRLEAGSEVWVTPAGDGSWAVPGGPPGLVCPATAVGAVTVGGGR